MFDNLNADDWAAFFELLTCVFGELPDADPNELAEILVASFPWLEDAQAVTLACLVELGVLEPA